MTKSETQAADYRAEVISAAALVATLTAERDASIQRADRESVKCSALADKVIGLRARVADLESQLESVACRAATAENRVEELEAAATLAPAASGAAEELVEERRSISTLIGKVEALERDNKRLRLQQRWIAVGDRLPDRMQTVWVSSSLGEHFASLDSYGQWLDHDENPGKKITHWMPFRPWPEAKG